MLTTDQARELANTVLAEQLGASGFAYAEIAPGEDHDGDPSLFLTVHFRRGSGVTEGQRSAEARVALRQRLRERGDERLIYLRYVYPDAVPSDPDAEEAA